MERRQTKGKLMLGPIFLYIHIGPTGLPREKKKTERKVRHAQRNIARLLLEENIYLIFIYSIIILMV